MESTARPLQTFSPQTVIDGRYEITRCIGMGSMSVVYAALRISDGVPCAIKILAANDSPEVSSAAFHTRFRIGVRMAMQVQDPHVVQVLDFVDQPDFVACVMELVEGGDLAACIRSSEAYSIPEIIRLLKQMLKGIGAIHRAGIIHRDIKPANVLLDANRDAKITDFGIAKNNGIPRLTADGGVIETVQYLSPEELRGEEPTQLSDIYALGIIAYEMVTGAELNLEKLVNLRATEDPLFVRAVNRSCPKNLSAWISKALQHDPSDRFPDIDSMLKELERLEASSNLPLLAAPGISKIFHTHIKGLDFQRAFEIFRSTGFQLILSVLLISLFAAALNKTPPKVLPKITKGPVSTAGKPSSNVTSASTNSELGSTSPQAPLELAIAAANSDELIARQNLLYRISDYVEWPKSVFPNAAVPLRLCILGKDPFGLDLDRVLSTATTRQGRGFWLQRFEISTAPEVLAGCQILYLGGIPSADLATVINSLRGLPVLTVTEASGQGIVDLVTRDGRVSFVVNQTLAKDSGMVLNPILRDVAASLQDVR